MKVSSESLFERAKKVAPGGVHSPVRAFKSVGGTPVFFKSAQGPWLQSVEDEQYIDFCQSFGPLLLGHRDVDVTNAVHEMIDTAWSFGACEPYSLELAEWITSRLPWVEKLRFVSSGTEAVMSALRVARAATKRSKILKFEGCYHGHVDSMLVKAGSGLAGESASDSAGVSESMAHETLVAHLDDEASVEEIFKKYPQQIAAIIIEPMPANYGLMPQRKEFLSFLKDIAHKNGALFIFDEVISGFRVALGGMTEITGIKPDLVTYGKVIGGGFPVGCYGGRADLLDMVAPNGPVYQAGTLSANPVGMKAGLVTLQKVESKKIYQVLEKRAKSFQETLNSEFKSKDIALEVDRVGSVFWLRAFTGKPVRSLKDIPSDHAANFKKLFHASLEEGVYLAPSGYEVGFISYAHTDNVLELATERLMKAIQKVYVQK